ncbi:MAG: adenosylcobinamide-GDP ribazoletransferase [Desulfobulbaceae bacterium]|nr:MAG: adenosylcobinamide-GDP ribazoletransferase [Desulfobulbaceae bacterium]
MKQPLLPFLAALRFLTIIPVSWRAESDGQYFAGGLFYFPLIGLVIGSLCAFSAGILEVFLPQSLVVFSGIVILAGFSGFLHVDGLADTADGLLSSRSREEKLAIMRDSRTGVMGVVSILVVLGGKFAALSALPHGMLLPALLLMPIAGRCAIVISMAMLSYARPEGGLGRLFYSAQTMRAAWFCTAFSGVLLCLSVVFSAISWKTSVWLVLVLTATLLLFVRWCRQSLGGATGDTLGAICEISELMTAVSFTIGLNGK